MGTRVKFAIQTAWWSPAQPYIAGYDAYNPLLVCFGNKAETHSRLRKCALSMSNLSRESIFILGKPPWLKEGCHSGRGFTSQSRPERITKVTR